MGKNGGVEVKVKKSVLSGTKKRRKGGGIKKKGGGKRSVLMKGETNKKGRGKREREIRNREKK